MVRKLLLMISPYLAGFFFITTIGFIVLAAYRGEMIVTLQSQLITNKDQQIKVIVEGVDNAQAISEAYELGKGERQIEKEFVVKQVDKIIEKPFYISTVCLDSDGLSVLNGSISATDASQPESTVPTATGPS
jgi:hypothetical protein